MQLSKTSRDIALFEQYFPQARQAFAATMVLFLITIFAYVGFHIADGSTKSRCAIAKSEGELTPCFKETPIVRFDNTDLLSYQINEAALNRFYDAAIADKFIRDFEADVAKERHVLTQERSYYFGKIRTALAERFNGIIPIEIPSGGSDLNDKYQRVLTATPLSSVIANLNKTILTLSVEQPQNPKNSVLILTLETSIESLKALQEREHTVKKHLLAKAHTLKPQMNFLWLYHPGSGWIFELVFWALFGLYCCTLTSLIKQTKLGQYNAKGFVMFFPRLLLAPILALVIVALLSSGYATYESNLNNFPYFLLLAFFLGFNSENVNAIIRDTSNKILRPIALSTDKMLEANKRTPRTSRYSDKTNPNEKTQVQTIDQLRDIAKKRAKSEAEKTVVNTTKVPPKGKL